MDERPHLIVIGNGMAASRAVDELLARAPRRYRITVVGAEQEPAYNRVLLSAALAGDVSLDGLALQTAHDLQGHGVEVITGRRVTAIDRDARCLPLDDGARLHYDRLLLATGARAVRPEVTGAHLPGVVAFRTLAHLQHVLDVCRGNGEAI